VLRLLQPVLHLGAVVCGQEQVVAVGVVAQEAGFEAARVRSGLVLDESSNTKLNHNNITDPVARKSAAADIRRG
jgi:hypothetical protein